MPETRAAYEALTDGLRRSLRLAELVEAGGERFPDLLPSPAAMARERALAQKHKRGLELRQAEFIAAVLADPRCGSHLLHAMAQPLPESLVLAPRFRIEGSADLGPVRVDREERIGQVTLQNHACLNAEDEDSTRALEIAVDLVLLDDAIEVGVLRGGPATHPKHAGRRMFGSGINLTDLYLGRISLVGFMLERELGPMTKMFRGHPLGAFSAGDAGERCEKPWIAAVDAFAVGGACQWLLVMDRVIAERGAWFSVPASREGVVPGCAPLRLPRFVGERLTRQAILFGRVFEAGTAEGRLIADEILPGEEIDLGVERAAAELMSAGAASAAANRRALRAAHEPLDRFRRYMSVYALEQARCLHSPALIENLERDWHAAREGTTLSPPPRSA